MVGDRVNAASVLDSSGRRCCCYDGWFLLLFGYAVMLVGELLVPKFNLQKAIDALFHFDVV